MKGPRIAVLAVLIVIGMLNAETLSAQQPPLPDNWYRVEMIVFSQVDKFGAETYPEKPQLAFPPQLHRLNAAEQLHTQVPADSPVNVQLAALMVPKRFLSHDQAIQPLSYAPLEGEERQLNPDAYTLQNNPNYEVLFHQAWYQPMVSRRNADWVLIEGGQPLGNYRELSGSIKIYRSRFFHVQTNLWLVHKATATSTGIEATSAEKDNEGIVLPPPPAKLVSPYIKQLGDMDDAQPFSLTMAETSEDHVEPAQMMATQVDVLQRAEQISSQQLHYLDHPRMGILLLVSPVEEAVPEEN